MHFQDFVQLPWQKQSTQTSHGLSAASSSSGDVGLSSSYGPASGRSASDFLSSAGNARMDNVSRALDISVEGFESSPVSILRCVAVCIDMTSYILLYTATDILTFHFAFVQSSQDDPAVDTAGLQFSKSLSTSELSLVESSDASVKVRLLSVSNFDSLRFVLIY